MRIEKRVKIQQSIIEDLKAENKRLKEELCLVKDELEFERTFKDNESDSVKDLMIELKKEKLIYKDLIQKANLAKNEYKEKTKELNELKIQFNKEMKNIIKQIKKGI